MSNPAQTTSTDKTTTTTAKTSSATGKDSGKVELGLLEEDDEFEEFETEEWSENDKDLTENANGDQNLWEDNWDDDNVEDDFTLQLRYGSVQLDLLRAQNKMYDFMNIA